MTEIRAAEPSAIRLGASLLRAGELVAFPTETVYGLGANALSDEAVERIFLAKGRPAHNPLIIHVPDLLTAQTLAVFDERALSIGAMLWPGPLTLVLPRRTSSRISERATAGLATVAVRIPAHPVAQQLLIEAGLPVAAPSANPSGRLSPTSAEHVADDLAGKVRLVLDGGFCSVGVESTVIDLTSDGEAAILRPGGLDLSRLEGLMPVVERSDGDPARPRAPGQLSGHYAPSLPIRLEAAEPRPNEALLAFGHDVPSGGHCTLNLSPSGDLAEAARNLFEMLRRLDRSGADAIAVMPIPAVGLGIAIIDRLSRAAAPRDGQACQNGLADSR
jgi:L-threonylcarbamoyladenylate synthase